MTTRAAAAFLGRDLIHMSHSASGSKILAAQGGTRSDARAWARSSPLADTEEVVAGLLRAWRDAGAEEAIADLPWPHDDETLERLAGPVQARLA